jgi:nitrate/TMAO reductase-like tetraheme cytochrome c subunit
VDADGPVAGATVHLQATRDTATTDADGRFRLPADPAAVHVTASKDGYFIGFAAPDASPLQITLKRLPAGDDPAYAWIDPGPDGPADLSCARCHADIYKEWSASAHSRSATGPHFRGLYDGTDWSGHPGVGWSLRDERPSGLGVCTSCHATAVADDDPALLDIADLRGTAARGVHCDYCHKVAAVGDGKLGLTHGRFNLTLRRSAKEPAFFGPLDDATRGDDVYSALYHDSRYCASCHEGVVFGVHVYSTYSEWQGSPAARQGRQCQDCHMKPTGRMTNVAPGHGGVERDPQTLSNHVFFDGGQEDMLKRCLRMTAECRRQGDGVQATVRLTAEGVGHRVPTGFIDKHLFLTIDGEDAAGKPVAARDGPRLPAPAGQGLAGRPGKLYARLLHDFDGRTPVPFWRADPDAADTRLEPGRPDETAYDFGPDLATVHVRVIYQRFWQESARAKGWPDADVCLVDQTIAVPQSLHP